MRLLMFAVAAFALGIVTQKYAGFGNIFAAKAPPQRKAVAANPWNEQRAQAVLAIPSAEDKIVFIGDSMVQLQEWHELLGDSRIINRGVSGDGVKGATQMMTFKRAQAVFILVGTNDRQNDMPLAEFEYGYRSLLAKATERCQPKSVFCLSIPPRIPTSLAHDRPEVIAEFNRAIQRACASTGVVYIDIHSRMSPVSGEWFTADGFHLSTQTYRLIAEMISPHLRSSERERVTVTAP